MKVKAFIYVILAGVLWGTSGIFVHYLSPYGFSSLEMTAVRGTVSFIAMLIYVLIANRGLLRVRAVDLIFFLAIGATLFGTASLYYTAMQMTSVSTAVVLMYTAPVYVTVFSVLFMSERLSGMKILAIALMLVGCSLVSGIVGGLKFDAIGILVGALTGIVYAAYNILTKLALKRGAHPVSTTLYAFLFMSVIAMSVAGPANIVTHASRDTHIVIPLLICIGFATCVIPYFLYTTGMRTLTASTATALGIVEPMSATVFSILLLGESADIFSGLGIVLILAAVLLLGRSDGSADDSKKFQNNKDN